LSWVFATTRLPPKVSPFPHPRLQDERWSGQSNGRLRRDSWRRKHDLQAASVFALLGRLWESRIVYAGSSNFRNSWGRVDGSVVKQQAPLNSERRKNAQDVPQSPVTMPRVVFGSGPPSDFECVIRETGLGLFRLTPQTLMSRQGNLYTHPRRPTSEGFACWPKSGAFDDPLGTRWAPAPPSMPRADFPDFPAVEGRRS